jgi:hypothetical protein
MLLDDRRQQAVIDSLEKASSPRVVIYTQWPPLYREQTPLARYLRERFTECEVDGTAQIWKRPSSAE